MGEHKKEKRKRRHRSSSSESPPRERRRGRSPPRSPKAAAGPEVTSEEICLSVEETNKLRAKLGLKPLEVNDGNSESAASKDVHVPAKNLTEEKRSAQVRERTLMSKRKRILREKLSKIKALGDSSSEDESASHWVQKSKKLEDEMAMAEQRAKDLAKLDEEFEIDRILDEERSKELEKKYTSRDLSGLKVDHSVDRFREGSSTILVVKDQSVLDDEGDVLMNVNIADDERHEKNVENRKQIGSVYNPYGDDEWDENGVYKPRSVLKKYDEEIHGASKPSFTITAHGNSAPVRAREDDDDRKRPAQQSLATGDFKLASDYYSPAELDTKFKKRKKKVRSKKLTADDLLSSVYDLNNDVRDREPESETNASVRRGKTQEEILAEAPMETDEAFEDLQSDLEKVRTVKQKMEHRQRAQKPEEYLARVIKPKVKDYLSDDDLPEVKGSIYLNSTAEFCRTLGELPTYDLKSEGAIPDDMDDDDQLEEEDNEDGEGEIGIYGHRKAHAGGWQEVSSIPEPAPLDLNAPRESARDYDSNTTSAGILDDEPVLSRGGVAAALNLASQKGYLEKEKIRHVTTGRMASIQAKHTVREEMRYDDIDAKFNKRDRFMGGAVSEFKELKGYKPDIKLEYVDDDTGRELNPKDAFDILSHRFHGKGSGKKKTEKKIKKVKEDMLLKNMSSSDTPLGTAEKLHTKLEKHGQHFLILSGKAAGTSLHPISK